MQFFDYVTFYHDIIKYTWEWSYEKLPYLDVVVEVRDKKIVTDVNSKPIDTHQYLDNGFCHSEHVKHGKPYSQALRLRRFCDSDETFEKRLEEMRGHFIKRGFKTKDLGFQFSKGRKKKKRKSPLSGC